VRTAWSACVLVCMYNRPFVFVCIGLVCVCMYRPDPLPIPGLSLICHLSHVCTHQPCVCLYMPDPLPINQSRPRRYSRTHTTHLSCCLPPSLPPPTQMVIGCHQMGSLSQETTVVSTHARNLPRVHTVS
jgi:hypothetical protein